MVLKNEILASGACFMNGISLFYPRSRSKNVQGKLLPRKRRILRHGLRRRSSRTPLSKCWRTIEARRTWSRTSAPRTNLETKRPASLICQRTMRQAGCMMAWICVAIRRWKVTHYEE